MERAVNPEDPVDCLLFLTNGKIKFCSIPKGILDQMTAQAKPGHQYEFKIQVGERAWSAWTICFAYCVGSRDG